MILWSFRNYSKNGIYNAIFVKDDDELYMDNFHLDVPMKLILKSFFYKSNDALNSEWYLIIF